MNDGYVAKEIFFASALLYAFGEEALLKIEFVDGAKYQETHFHIDCPSLDAQELVESWKAKSFGVTDLSSYTGIYTRLVKILKQMRRDNKTEWSGPSWIAGRG